MCCGSPPRKRRTRQLLPEQGRLRANQPHPARAAAGVVRAAAAIPAPMAIRQQRGGAVQQAEELVHERRVLVDVVAQLHIRRLEAH